MSTIKMVAGMALSAVKEAIEQSNNMDKFVKALEKPTFNKPSPIALKSMLDMLDCSSGMERLAKAFEEVSNKPSPLEEMLDDVTYSMITGELLSGKDGEANVELLKETIEKWQELIEEVELSRARDKRLIQRWELDKETALDMGLEV